MTAALKIFRQELIAQRQRLAEFSEGLPEIRAIDAIVAALDRSIERSGQTTVDLIVALTSDVPRGQP